MERSPASACKEGFAQRLLDAVCKNLEECRLSYDDASQRRALFGGLEGCRVGMAAQVGDAAPFLFGIDVRGYTYQRSEADSCLTKFPHPCFMFEVEEPQDSLGSICAEVFDGSAPMGGPCMRGLDCAGDACCAVTNDQCPGTCAPRKQPGDVCMLDSDCALGGAQAVFCQLPEGGTQTQDEGRCVRATHIRHAGEGEVCEIIRAGTDATLALCNDGLVCVATKDGHHCQKPVAARRVCTENRECEAEALCLRDPGQDKVGVPVRHCVSFIRHGEGEMCSQEPGPFDGPASAICWSLKVPLFCNETGHCARPTVAKEGESCEQFDCAEGLACWRGGLDQVEVCRRPAAVGASCESSPCVRTANCANGICSAQCGD